jgi:hypothetical protein
MTERDSIGDERVAQLNQAPLGRPSIQAAQGHTSGSLGATSTQVYFSNGRECALSAGPVELAVFHQRNDHLLPPRSQQSWKSL